MSSLSDMRHTKCPHCEQQMSRFPALSRRDNKTLICSDCGRREALEDIIEPLNPVLDRYGAEEPDYEN